jgi:hypothetical protein
LRSVGKPREVLGVFVVVHRRLKMPAEHPGGFGRGGMFPLIRHADGKPRATAINNVVYGCAHVGDAGAVLLVFLEGAQILRIIRGCISSS